MQSESRQQSLDEELQAMSALASEFTVYSLSERQSLR